MNIYDHAHRALSRLSRTSCIIWGLSYVRHSDAVAHYRALGGTMPSPALWLHHRLLSWAMHQSFRVEES
jgi:hypothetical protein